MQFLLQNVFLKGINDGCIIRGRKFGKEDVIFLYLDTGGRLVTRPPT